VVVLGTSLGVGWLLEANAWHYHWLLVVAAVCGMASTWVFARMKVRGERRQMEEPEEEPFSLISSFRILLENKPFGLYMAFQMITGVAFLTSSPAMIRYLNDLNVPYDQAAVVLSVIPSALLIVTLPLWSRLLQGVEPMKSRLVLCCFWASGFLILGLSRNLAWIYVGQVVIGLASGGGSLLWTLAQMHYSERKHMPLYSGIHATLTGIRGFTAPVLGAWLLTVMSPKSVFFVTAGLMGMGVIYPQVLRLAGGLREKR
jgi:Na+/melibiose symporter-like transporter